MPLGGRCLRLSGRPGSSPARIARPGNAGVAQLVEQRFCNAKVAGSIPAEGTTSRKSPDHLFKIVKGQVFAGDLRELVPLRCAQS